MDRQVFIALETLRDSWMGMLPMSTMIEERRQNQYLADVAQENADRETRKVWNLWIRTHKRLETDGMLHK